MMRRILILMPMFCLAGLALLAQTGYAIRVQIKGFSEKKLYLAYYYGDKQYIKDTAVYNTEGWFEFKGNKPLEGGVYMIVLPPDNKYFEIMVDKNEQQFSIQTERDDLSGQIIFGGQSFENQLFYKYINFQSLIGKEEDQLKADMAMARKQKTDTSFLQEKMDSLENANLAYQKKLIKNYPGSLTASLIKATLPVNNPEFAGSKKEVETKSWQYAKNHFFDNMEMGDPRLLRSPVLFSKINYFIENLQVQHPDSLCRAIDFVMNKLSAAPESYKFYLIHFLNKYASSKIVGMDAVYVHLAKNYYAKGKAPWTEKEQLQKIIDNANTLDPILIGKKAPSLPALTRKGMPFDFGMIPAAYTIVYFWRENCSLCKSDALKLKQFYEKYKSRGVRILSVCIDQYENIDKNWKYVDENGLDEWTHVYFADPKNLLAVLKTYDIKSSPLIYVLNDQQVIQSKRIGVNQLDMLMDMFLK